MNIDLRTAQLIDIISITEQPHTNMVDISVEDDESFIFGNGIVSHNSARLSIQSARGKNPYIGSFSLRGKPLNIQDTELKDIITNTEIRNILTITGLEFGKKVETLPDGKWIQLNIDGQVVVVNENDEIFYDNRWISVRSLL